MRQQKHNRMRRYRFIFGVSALSLSILLAHTFLGVVAQPQMGTTPSLLNFGATVPGLQQLQHPSESNMQEGVLPPTLPPTAEVVLNPAQLFLQSSIQFPYLYTLTGIGDLSWKDLSNRFYDTEAFADQIAYSNPLLTEKELVQGVKVTIPAPDSEFSNKISSTLLRTQQEQLQPDFSAQPVKSEPDSQVEPKQDNQEDFSPNHLSITPEEFDLYTRVLACEGGPNWDYKGLRMLAETITNRVRNYHKSFREILMQPGQYSVIDSGVYLQATPSPLILQVARDSLLGNLYLDPSVEFFCTQEAYDASSWFQSLRLVERYDNTVFLAQ